MKRTALQLEQLDDRLVPSATSALSIYHFGLPGWTEHDFAAIDAQSRQLVLFRDHSRSFMSGPQLTDVSLSVTSTGWFSWAPEVFALDTSHRLWLCDASGNWSFFGGNWGSISATRDGHVYGLSAYDNSIAFMDSQGLGNNLGVPGSNGLAYALQISAGQDGTGNDQLFAIGPGGAIYVNKTNAPGGWQLVDNSHFYYAISAGLHDTVYALDDAGNLYQENEYSFWIWGVHVDFWAAQGLTTDPGWHLDPNWRLTAISADSDGAGHDEVYAADMDGQDYRFSSAGHQVVGTGAEVAGADGGWFFSVESPRWGSIGYEYDPWGGCYTLPGKFV
jgi:hypothetical protein